MKVPYGAELDGAVALGYGGLDSYGFHTLEALSAWWNGARAARQA